MPYCSFKRILSIVLGTCVTMNVWLGGFCQAVFALPELTVAEAQRLAILHDEKLKSIKTKTAFQHIKRKQAQEGVADIRKKERTVRFSLLFSIKMPEKHGLPKEADLLAKLPTIDSETAVLEQEAIDRELVVKELACKTVIKTYSLQESIRARSESLQLEEANLARMKNRVLLGVASQKDLDALKSDCEAEKQELMTLRQKLENEAGKLSELIGQDVSNGCVFKNPLTTIVVPREKTNTMVDYAMQNRYDVHQAEAARKLACRNVELLYEIYQQQFESKAKVLENEVRSEDAVDYDAFIRKYEEFLTNVDQPWEKVYTIWLLFFKINIPKEWFKGEFSGARYFEDKKYALPEMMRERDDAKAQEAIVKKTVEESVRSSYEVLMELERAYRSGSLECERLGRVYEETKVRNMLGTATFAETQQAKSNLDQAQKDERERLVGYNELLASLDKDTCGWVSQFKKGEDLINVSVSSGDSLGNPKPSYLIQTTIDPLQATFSLTIPEGSGVLAEEYELWVGDCRVGRRMKVPEPMVVLPVEITGMKRVTVKLFEGNEFVDEAEFDGLQTSGKLGFKVSAARNDLISQEREDALRAEVMIFEEEDNKEEVGAYLIEDLVVSKNAGVFKKFVLSEAPTGAAYYKLNIEEREDAFLTDHNMHSIDKEIVKLGLMFEDESKVVIVFYDGGRTELFRARLEPVRKGIIRID